MATTETQLKSTTAKIVHSFTSLLLRHSRIPITANKGEKALKTPIPSFKAFFISPATSQIDAMVKKARAENVQAADLVYCATRDAETKEAMAAQMKQIDDKTDPNVSDKHLYET